MIDNRRNLPHPYHAPLPAHKWSQRKQWIIVLIAWAIVTVPLAIAVWS